MFAIPLSLPLPLPLLIIIIILIIPSITQNYATNVKLGVIEDTNNRARLSKLLMFQSSKTGDLSTFEEYVTRMKENQTQIYYLAGESKDSVEKSPLMEILIKRGYEVSIYPYIHL